MDLLSYSMLLFRIHHLMAMSTTWFHLSALSEALGMRCNKETSAEAVISHDAGAFRSSAASDIACLMDTRRGCDDTQDKGGGWLFVGRDPCRPPHQTLGATQVRFSSKLKK
jgi:hypothetical protein